MSATIDAAGLLGLLHENEHYSLPYAVRPQGESDLRRLVGSVQDAIAAANVAAARRVPTHPTWSTEGMLAGDVIVGEVTKGAMEDDEVMAWFSDLAEALGDSDVLVEPYRASSRVPSLDGWLELPPSLTAFLDFLPADADEWMWEATPVVREVASDLAEWAHLPGGTVTISRAATASFVTSPASAGRELRTSMELDPQHWLRVSTEHPRRARTADFTFNAKGHLQIVDETRSAVECLPHLIDGLRLISPVLAQARVRRAVTLLPDELDVRHVAGREPTEAEEWATYAAYIHLLSEYVIDAYVAQVLTATHMDKIGSLEGFEVQALEADRYLVVARDPEPWLSGPSPNPGVLQEARHLFAPAMLTTEVVAANRRHR